MRAALYVRVSTDTQEAGNQVTALKEFCISKAWGVTHSFVDVCSGSKEARPGFDQLFLAAHKAEFDIVLFWALDRFSRSGTLYTLQRLKELENLGIDWHSFQEPYVSTTGPFKEVVIAVLASLAKAERERISERTKAGLRNSPNKEKIGKRGKDKKPRRVRSDRGMPRKPRKR